MEKQSLKTRIVRKIVNFFIVKPFFKAKTWYGLRFYPAVVPNPTFLQECTESDCAVYQQWLDLNILADINSWSSLRNKAINGCAAPRISIVTPVYNTDPDILEACVLSVRAQAYPFWQLVLVDDGSTLAATHAVLASPVCQDPRVHIYYQLSQGISAATNVAINYCKGDYVVFLDHDDRLSLDALFYLAECIQTHPETDIIYSDRDMIMPNGSCDMHLFKPDWSPETLLSGNYVFHLMCYRRQLLLDLGGLRTEFDGSQDYDLILRASETDPKVQHITHVLYHWRQHQQSVALNVEAKEYAFAAGVKALNATLKRRLINGSASEIKSLWRGNYQLDLAPVECSDIALIRVNADLNKHAYAASISKHISENNHQQAYIAIISSALTAQTHTAIQQLVAWLRLDRVGFATARIDTDQQQIHYAGMVFKKDGSLLMPYQGFPEAEAGYMAVTRITRNISAPHPFCVVLRREIWQQFGGFDSHYCGPYALLDLSLQALAAGWRCVFVPQLRFITSETHYLRDLEVAEQQFFQQRWQHWLARGDPYYNCNLHEHSADMGLQISRNPAVFP